MNEVKPKFKVGDVVSLRDDPLRDQCKRMVVEDIIFSASSRIPLYSCVWQGEGVVTQPGRMEFRESSLVLYCDSPDTRISLAIVAIQDHLVDANVSDRKVILSFEHKEFHIPLREKRPSV